MHEGDLIIPPYNAYFSYDADGNPTADGRWNYTWDGENRLVGMEMVSAIPAGRKKMTFSYDYMGRRILKTTHDWNSGSGTWSAGLVRRFYYNGWNLVGESDDFGYRKSFLWGPDLSGTMQGAGGVGGLLSVTEKPVAAPWQVSYAISDANGNVMKLVDSETLATVAEYEYGPFGELIRMLMPSSTIISHRLANIAKFPRKEVK